MPTARLKTQCFGHVDTIKAIAMVLVLVGHAPGLNLMVMNFIYAFHMPVFFFVSGLLLSKAKLAMPFRQFVMAQFRSLGVPYLFFFFLSYIYWLPTRGLSASTLKNGPIAWWEPLLDFFTGSQQAWVINTVLWFFVSLFMTACIYYVARRFFSTGFLALLFSLIGAVFSLVYVDTWPRWPWRLDSTLIALGFYSVGQYVRAPLARPFNLSPTHAAALAGLLFFGVLLGATLNGKVDLNFLQFGTVPMLYFVNAYLGIFALLFASQLFPRERVLAWIARNAIIIFPSHLLFYSLFTGIGVVLLGWPHSFKESSWIWEVIFPILALGLSYPLSLILTRCCPIFFGNRTPHANLHP